MQFSIGISGVLVRVRATYVPLVLAGSLSAACGSSTGPAATPETSVPSSANGAGAAEQGTATTPGDSVAESRNPGEPTTPASPVSAEEGAVNEAPADGKYQFKLTDSHTAKQARGVNPSKIKPTKTEAALKFIVVDKDKGPIPKMVITLTAPNGTKYYTPETDAEGYTELLVPIGQKYDLVYLSLGQGDIAATVNVAAEPNQSVKLTLRYKGYIAATDEAPRFVLDGVNFDTGKATLRPESFARLDGVVEYMLHKTSSRIEISGHTDNVGNPKANKALSEKRAQACRDYLISKGIDASRVRAVGYGDERPVAPNDSAEGRQKNRRIEANEL